MKSIKQNGIIRLCCDDCGHTFIGDEEYMRNHVHFSLREMFSKRDKVIAMCTCPKCDAIQSLRGLKQSDLDIERTYNSIRIHASMYVDGLVD